MEDKELSVGRRAELARRNMQLDQIREIGRGLVFGRFKGKNICAEREIRQEASVEHEESGICGQTRQNHKWGVPHWFEVYKSKFWCTQRELNYSN